MTTDELLDRIEEVVIVHGLCTGNRTGLESLTALREHFKPPEVPEWEALVRLAYADGGDASLRINRITTEYNRVRQQIAEMERWHEAADCLTREVAALRQDLSARTVERDRLLDECEARHDQTVQQQERIATLDRTHSVYASKVEQALGPLTTVEAEMSVPDIIAGRTVERDQANRELFREMADNKVLRERIATLEAALRGAKADFIHGCHRDFAIKRIDAALSPVDTPQTAGTCVRCGAPYLPHGQCSNHAKGCQGGRGENPNAFSPSTPSPSVESASTPKEP